MVNLSWLEKVTNEEVLRRVNEKRQANTELYFAKETPIINHVLRHDGLLHEIIEGRMRGKPTRGRIKTHMLHESTNDVSYIALKQAAEEREGWRHR